MSFVPYYIVNAPADTSPVLETPVVGNGQLTVTAVSTGGDTLRIYKSTVSGGPWTFATEVPIYSDDDRYTFLIPGLTNGVTYYLKAGHRLEADLGVEDFSNEVSGTPAYDGPAPVDEADPIVSVLEVEDGALTLLVVSDEDYRATLAIYTSATAGSGHTFATNTPIGADAEGNKVFRLTGLTNGVPVYIIVREERAGPTYVFSDEVQGVPFDPNEVIPTTRIRRAKILRII